MNVFRFCRLFAKTALLRVKNVNNACRTVTEVANKAVFGEVNYKFDHDLVLYRSENGGQLWKLHIYSAICCLASIYSSIFLYVAIKPSKRDSESAKSTTVSFFSRCYSVLEKYKLFVTGFLALFGVTQCVAMSLFIRKNVHSIVLLKNGNKVLLKTFRAVPKADFVMSKILPLKSLSCHHGRNQRVSYMVLEIGPENRKVLIDTSGVFHSPEVFDNTVGIYRKLKK